MNSRAQNILTRTPPALWVGAALWLTVIIAVMVWISAYSNTPSPASAPPVHWPSASQIQRLPDQPTLVMFAHPRCPCTRASVGELESLLARMGGKFTAQVWFLRPAGTAPDWAQTDLWRKAAAIPGVTVHEDNAGNEARRFSAETSGHTLLYGPNGNLLFQGGITISRGHSGDNPGRSALMARLEHQDSDQIQTPVFGCSLFATEYTSGASACKR